MRSPQFVFLFLLLAAACFSTEAPGPQGEFAATSQKKSCNIEFKCARYPQQPFEKDGQNGRPSFFTDDIINYVQFPEGDQQVDTGDGAEKMVANAILNRWTDTDNNGFVDTKSPQKKGANDLFICSDASGVLRSVVATRGLHRKRAMTVNVYGLFARKNDREAVVAAANYMIEKLESEDRFDFSSNGVSKKFNETANRIGIVVVREEEKSIWRDISKYWQKKWSQQNIVSRGVSLSLVGKKMAGYLAFPPTGAEEFVFGDTCEFYKKNPERLKMLGKGGDIVAFQASKRAKEEMLT